MKIKLFQMFCGVLYVPLMQLAIYIQHKSLSYVFSAATFNNYLFR